MIPKYSEITDLIKKGATLEAQEKIMELREAALYLQEENIELKNQLKIKDDLLNKIQEYSLVEAPGGAMIYEFVNEPKHYICPKCFSKKEIHILQNKHVSSGDYTCPNCKNDFCIDNKKKRTNYQTKYRAI
jgi:Zn finger protein HypA/HybF involved in hydrogenase expression